MKKPEYMVVMRQCQNDCWDPDDRVGDAQVVAILEDPAEVDRVIRKDAKRKLKELGVERADGEKDYDAFVEGAVDGPVGQRDRERLLPLGHRKREDNPQEERQGEEMSFDFAEAFAKGMAEVGGTFAAASPGRAQIGIGERTLFIGWESGGGRFRAYAGGGAPLLEFSCATDGWEAWQAVDAGRDFAKRAYEIADRLGK